MGIWREDDFEEKILEVEIVFDINVVWGIWREDDLDEKVKVDIDKEAERELGKVIDIEVDFVLIDIGIVSLFDIMFVEGEFEINIDKGKFMAELVLWENKVANGILNIVSGE